MNREKHLFWDAYSSRFNSIYGNTNSMFNMLINNLFRRSMRLRFEKTINNISGSASSVLDIGCGPGHFCLELAKKNISVITGIDFSGEMIELAKKNAAVQGLEGRIDFKVCDFLSFQPGRQYEYSIMMGFIEYFEYSADVLKQAIELTKKQVFVSFPEDGGILAFQRKLRYKNRCFLKLYKRREIIDLLSDLKITSYNIEKVARDFYVTINI